MLFGKAPRAFNPGIDQRENNHGLSEEAWKRLNGRYGCAADPLVRQALPADLSTLPGTEALWAEIAHAARHERVRHLGDLLLRRVRIGLLTREGGRPHFRRIKRLCRPYLPWSRKRWREEIRLYTDQWNRAYGLPLEPAGVLKKAKSRSREVLGGYLGRIVFRIYVRLSHGLSKKKQ